MLAIATWAAAHSAATSAAEAARQRGIELEESGDHVGALGEYRRAVELDPEDAANLVSLAIGLCKTGDHAGALATYERAAKLAPDNPDVLSNQALELEEGGHPDDARALMERAKALVPKGTQTEHRIDRWLAGHRVE